MVKRIGLFLLTNLAVLVVLGVVMSVLGVGSYLDRSGGLNLQALLIFSAVIGFTGSFISLAISKWMAKSMMGVQVIERPSNDVERWLVDTVRAQAKASGIGMPEVGIYDGAEMNAFATGMNRNNALVAVSSGLMQQMRRDEVEAVLAHEVSHVANGDMITLSLIQGVVNTFVIFLSRVIGHVVDRVILKNERGHGIGFFVTSLVAQIVLGIIANMVVMWFSRLREYRADAGSARLVGKEKMIAALRRLKGDDGEGLPDQFAAFGISGGIPHGLQRLFLSHPPLDERIAALQQG